MKAARAARESQVWAKWVGRLPCFSSSISSSNASLLSRRAQSGQISGRAGLPHMRHTALDLSLL